MVWTGLFSSLGAAPLLPWSRPSSQPSRRLLGAARRLEQHGSHKEARKHLKRALGINRRALGEEHASTKDTAANLERLEKGT